MLNVNCASQQIKPEYFASQQKMFYMCFAAGQTKAALIHMVQFTRLEDMAMADNFQPQIPAEMRDFAERSVIQARKAFEGFMGAVYKTSANTEAAADAGAQEAGVKDLGAKAVAFAESNVNAAFDLAEKLVHAKDVQEVLSLQAEYLKSQIEAVQQQAREMGEAVQKAAGVKK